MKLSKTDLENLNLALNFAIKQKHLGKLDESIIELKELQVRIQEEKENVD